MNAAVNSFPDTTLPFVAQNALVGESDVMQAVFRLIDRVAPTEASVLLTGESGSGKELAAHSIHERSLRRNGPFISISCGAIAAGMLETELFGYGKGYMGAARSHEGVFERALGGTLFLDDITHLPLELQTRLQRVLETRTFYRAGDSEHTLCDVRVIASTKHCPLQAVQSGRLREDLLYRLAVFPIDLPPLRHRGEDVEVLAEHFLAALNRQGRSERKLSAAARRMLRQHTWPGNVRELKNCIERAFILGDQALDITPLVQSDGAREAVDGELDRLDIRVGSKIYDMEKSLIEATLQYFKGNKRRAADALGCSLKTLYNKLNGYSQSQHCVGN